MRALSLLVVLLCCGCAAGPSADDRLERRYGWPQMEPISDPNFGYWRFNPNQAYNRPSQATRKRR